MKLIDLENKNMTESIEKKIHQLELDKIVVLEFSKGKYKYSIEDYEEKLSELQFYINKINIKLQYKKNDSKKELQT